VGSGPKALRESRRAMLRTHDQYQGISSLWFPKPQIFKEFRFTAKQS